MVKGEVCKTSMQRFESARRLQILLHYIRDSNPRSLLTTRNFPVLDSSAVFLLEMAPGSSRKTVLALLATFMLWTLGDSETKGKRSQVSLRCI